LPLRHRLALNPETVQELALAATQRYYEALELLVRGQAGGGVYLMGYVAEILLKSAYFMATGARPADAVQPRLGPARAAGRQLVPHVDPEHYHSVAFWAQLLLAIRHRANRPLSPEIEPAFRQRTRRLYQNWWVAMRYHRDESLPVEVRSVLDDVDWLRANHLRLWS
jgi:hypothetical protein